MINLKTDEYYQKYYGAYLSDYMAKTQNQDTRFNYILAFIVICIILATIAIAKPIFAQDVQISPPQVAHALRLEEDTGQIYTKEEFETNIKNKYKGSFINFPTKGAAYIKKTKYINSKPIKINIVEINTKVNPYLKIKPQTASQKLQARTTVRKIAQKDNAIIAINGGFFKPQTGVPLGALMIDRKVLTGPIYNRVGIAIFEEGTKTSFKMQNIDFDIKAYTKNAVIKIDNINQPRMLCTHILMYTSTWGNISPIAPKNGYNMLVSGNKITKISANPIPIKENEVVLSAPKNIISKLAKNNDEIYINIKLQEELERATHIIGAGPYLIKDSQIYVDTKIQKLEAIGGKNPRSAVGYKSDGTFIIVMVNGREEKSVGMTLYELAKFMKELGCEYAMNFDGGSSSTMYVNGKVINTVANKEGIPVSNALTIRETASESQISSL